VGIPLLVRCGYPTTRASTRCAAASQYCSISVQHLSTGPSRTANHGRQALRGGGWELGGQKVRNLDAQHSAASRVQFGAGGAGQIADIGRGGVSEHARWDAPGPCESCASVVRGPRPSPCRSIDIGMVRNCTVHNAASASGSRIISPATAAATAYRYYLPAGNKLIRCFGPAPAPLFELAPPKLKT
jgi:hypothetical protein